MRRLYLASNNRHKLDELATLVGPGWDLRLARDLDPLLAWDETGSTFAANARIKALAVRALTAAAVLADDSGLEVRGLGGAPGVHSARYAGVDGDVAANNAKLLRETAGMTAAQRAATFVCVLCFLDESGTERLYRGECHGQIVAVGRGAQGFGYDPLFQLAGAACTMAELDEAAKNAVSHRGAAVRAWLADLKA